MATQECPVEMQTLFYQMETPSPFRKVNYWRNVGSQNI